ncbi:MAG TPA: F0F1 ATP synthase subunit B [Longimicrobiales bacterium]|nr:F0F1 ATP synthase subunit B [Longimicrobiales bacterium]
MRASRITTTALVLLALAPGSAWAQGGGEGGGGLYDINTGLSVWTLLVFAILVVVLGKFAWGPILNMVEEREKGIQAKLDEAAALNADAAKLLEQHREQLADARRQASELIAEGRTAAERVRKDIEEKARAEGQAIIERARAEIERERDAAIDMLRKESVDLALAAASKLMQENLDQAKDRALVERFLGELGTKGGARA